MAHKKKDRDPKFHRFKRARQTAQQAHAAKMQMMNKAATQEISAMHKMANDPNVSAHDRFTARRRASRVPTLLARHIEKAGNDFERANRRIDTKEVSFSQSIAKNMERLEIKYRIMGHGGRVATDMARSEMQRRMGGNIDEFLPKAKRVRQQGYQTSTFIKDPRQLTRVREAAQRAAQSRDTNYVERPKSPGWKQREKKKEAFEDRMDKARTSTYRFHEEKMEREKQETQEWGEKLTPKEQAFMQDRQDRDIADWEGDLKKGLAKNKGRKDKAFLDWKKGMEKSIFKKKYARDNYAIGTRWGQFKDVSKGQINAEMNRQGLRTGYRDQMAKDLMEKSGIFSDDPVKPHNFSLRLGGPPDKSGPGKIKPGQPGRGFGQQKNTPAEETQYRRRIATRRTKDELQRLTTKAEGIQTRLADRGFARDDAATSDRTRSLIDKLLQDSATGQRMHREDESWFEEQREASREWEERTQRNVAKTDYTKGVIDKLLRASDPNRGFQPKGYDDEFDDWDIFPD